MESPQRLYLSKGEDLVFVDNCNVPQHIEGIRFLYRLFKKNSPGAIVNDPMKFDKDVQLVLFLKAVCHLLNKTILVLCPDGTENDWLEMFRSWTDLGDDVVIESAKQYLKKKVIINGMVNLPLFSQRNWSIVVVTDNSLSSNVLKYMIKADFKIWNTSLSMKKNLGTFSKIYNWITSGKGGMGKFNICDYIPDRNSVRDIMDKAILLDAFMEDIVIRRTKTRFNFEIPENPPPKIISRKNKDATGTKIKRSKRKIEDDNTDTKSDENTGSTVPKLSKPTTEDNEEGKSDSVINPDASVVQDQNFTQEPVVKSQVEESNTTAVSQDSNIHLVYDVDAMTESDAIYDMNTQVDDGPSTVNVNNDRVCKIKEYYDDSVRKDTKKFELNEIFNSNEGNWRASSIDIQSGDDQSQESDMDEVPVRGIDNAKNTEELVTEVTEKEFIINPEKSNDIMVPDKGVTAVILTKDYVKLNVAVNDEVKKSSDGIEKSVNKDLDEFDRKNNEIKEQAIKRFKGSVLDSIF